MPERFEPKIASLPKPQQEIWSLLAPSVGLSYVLYGGTAVVLYLGHRVSVDFDFFFFRSAPLDKTELETRFEFVRCGQTIQEDVNTLVVMARMPSGAVKVSFFGGMTMGKINEPLQTADASLLVASCEMYGKDPSLPLRAIGYFKDGDLPSLAKSDQDTLRAARDRVSNVPDVLITKSLVGLLT
jgi:hypothetical protein